MSKQALLHVTRWAWILHVHSATEASTSGPHGPVGYALVAYCYEQSLCIHDAVNIPFGWVSSIVNARISPLIVVYRCEVMVTFC
jgi:putative lipase involved disintegration of autophagic bodies